MQATAALEALGTFMEAQQQAAADIAARWLYVRGREGQLQPLVANAAQQAFERRRGRQNIVLKARQMGITTWIAGRFFLRTITRPGTLTVQVAHTQAAAEAIFRSVQRMWECLPAELREGPLKLSRSNAGQMVFAELDSEFRIMSAGDANAGRGVSIQNLHCSEVSRWPGDAAETLAGLRAALAPDGELVLESTPNGAYGAFYEEWQRAEGPVFRAQGPEGMTLEGMTLGDKSTLDPGPWALDPRMVRHFLPWWMEPAYVGAAVSVAEMTAAEQELVARHGLSAEQIGFRRGLERSYGVLRSQEFAEDAETCFRATGACFFDVEAIERRLAEVAEPFVRRRNGALHIWCPPAAGRDYVVAVDTAGGGEDGDYAAVQVVDRQTGLQCAELQERLRPAELARVAAELGREYGGYDARCKGESLLAVERNNHGAAVVAYLETSECYERLYRERGEAGWLTTSASKPEMIARLGVLLTEAPQIFASRRLLGECRTFVSGERGRTGAANGAHDDLVMAMALAQAIRARV